MKKTFIFVMFSLIIGLSLIAQTVKDIDGNVYQTVVIGKQIWLKENLKTTKFRDGTSIQLVTDNTEWANKTTPAYCWYNNDSTTYKNTYGALYNWYAANDNLVCPIGWHVPLDSEWKILEMYLGLTQDEANAEGYQGTDQGSQIKTTSGWTSGGNGTNTSGFSAPPSGYRNPDINISWQNLGAGFVMWGASSKSSTIDFQYGAFYNTSKIYRASGSFANDGLSIRCIHDQINYDTLTYNVSNINFQVISPKVYFEKTDTLKTAIGSNDSIVNHFSKYVYQPNHYTDTITVEDTLKFNVVLTGIAAPNNLNKIKVYPNPTKDYLMIDCGDYAKMDKYQFKLLNISSAVIWSTTVTQKVYSISLSGYSKGTYFLQIIDSSNKTLEVKKIVLQ
jgi:uncharacterized protein (TIGR02145 family)